MKRSRNDATATTAGEMVCSHGFVLPPFARWTLAEFGVNASRARRLIDARLG